MTRICVTIMMTRHPDSTDDSNFDKNISVTQWCHASPEMIWHCSLRSGDCVTEMIWPCLHRVAWWYRSQSVRVFWYKHFNSDLLDPSMRSTRCMRWGLPRVVSSHASQAACRISVIIQALFMCEGTALRYGSRHDGRGEMSSLGE